MGACRLLGPRSTELGAVAAIVLHLALLVRCDQCFEAALHAQADPEPGYLPHKLADTGVQEVFHRWHGLITREQIDAKCSLTTLELWSSFGLTPANVPIVRYKIVKRRLYASKERFSYEDAEGIDKIISSERRGWFEEMALYALYLFDEVPDMEFLVNLQDEPWGGCAALSYAMDARNASTQGFMLPCYRVWFTAMTQAQAQAYSGCLADLYPANTRQPQAVWRGSSTSAGGRHEKHNWLSMRRTRLAILGALFPRLLDAGYVRYINVADDVKVHLEEVAPLKGSLDFEDFNKYAAILDVDGNSWSDRFASMLRFNTPLLKQKPDYYDYFFHWLEPGKHFLEFEEDLSNLIPVVQHTLHAWQAQRPAILGVVQHAQEFATEKFSHPKVAAALAQSLLTFKAKSGFQFDPDLSEYVRVDASNCCVGSRSMPQEVAQKVRDFHANW